MGNFPQLITQGPDGEGHQYRDAEFTIYVDAPGFCGGLVVGGGGDEIVRAAPSLEEFVGGSARLAVRVMEERGWRVQTSAQMSES